MEHDDPPPSPQPNPSPETDLEAIPGLGVIRLRTLRKAGWTVERLRAATVEEIAAIPGISTQKAAEIARYLQDEPAAAAECSEELAPAAESPTEPSELAAVADPADPPVPASRPGRSEPIMTAVGALTEAVAFLYAAAPKGSLCRRLARQMRRWLWRCAELTKPAPGSGIEAEALALAGAIADGPGKRKRQVGIARRLRKVRRTLMARRK